MDVSLYAICQDANPLLRPTGTWADLSQTRVNAGGRLQKKMAPENRGHWFNPSRGRAVRPIAPVRRNPVFSGSETETGEVAVANGDAGTRGQQAVDRGHQAAEESAGGCEAEGGGLGHFVPFSESRSGSAS